MDPRRWETIQAAFDALVELDAGERASRLAALGGTDPELRAAVESLLVADAQAETRLGPLEAALLGAPSPAPDPFGLTGQTVSHFRVLEPLGAGGMGVIYRAEDTRLGRAVALKFLLPPYSMDAAAKARFLHEAHAAAALDHPNLCTIHEVGGSVDGRLFLAMALYPGATLKERLVRRGPLPVGEALAIARQIAEGLACAHAAGIVHRDLKPGNVMLLPDGTVKVLDFGLAKARDQNPSASSARWGTVAYMAPEQIRGEAVDGRADLWALGVVLYEMLTGRKPFSGEHEGAIAHAILHDEPVAPSALRTEVPAVVEEIILTLLAKEPARRYTATGELLGQLAAAGSIDEVRLPPRRRRRLRTRWALRWRPSVVAAMGIAIALAAAAFLAGRYGGEDAGAASRVVVMPFENRSADSALDALGVITADWMTQGLTGATFLTVYDVRSALVAAQTLGRAATPVTVGRETGADVVVSGSYFLQRDSLRFQAQLTSTADGTILAGIGGVTALQARPLDGIEQLRQRLLAALASLHDREVTTFQAGLAQPPTYAAYREYTEGLEAYLRTAWSEAARRFQQGADLDTSFLTANLWAAQTWLGFDNARFDSVMDRLRPRRHRLGRFDRARFDFVEALHAQDPHGAYGAALRMLEAAPGSEDARREAALSAMRVLRGREALQRLRDLDPERGLMRHWGDYWSAVAWTHHMLGEHREELAAARRGRELFPGSGHFRLLELRALAALGGLVELDSIVRTHFPAFPGQIGILARATTGELLAHGHAEPARRLARYAGRLLAARPPSEQTSAEWLRQHADLTDLSGEREGYLSNPLERLETSSTSTSDRAREEWLHQRAELALLLDDAAGAAKLAGQLRDPDAHRLLPARLAGAQGRHEAARAALARAEDRFLHHWGNLRGLALDRASALVRMDDLEGALDILTEALTRGLIIDSRWGNDGHARADLAPLWPDPRFRALIKPRG